MTSYRDDKKDEKRATYIANQTNILDQKDFRGLLYLVHVTKCDIVFAPIKMEQNETNMILAKKWFSYVQRKYFPQNTKNFNLLSITLLVTKSCPTAILQLTR